MYDVITVGSATIDAFAKTAKSDLISIQSKNEKENESFLAYPTGTKIIIDELEFTTGGGGTNTAVAMSRLGLTVGYTGKVGKYQNGKMIIQKLKEEKVDFLGTTCVNESGYSIILDSISHDRTILTYKGANNDFQFKDLNKRKLATKWFYCCAMVEKAYAELVKLMKYAKQNNIKVMFNPSSYLADKGLEFLKEALDYTDCLVLNKEEAQILVGKHDCKTLLKLLQNFIGFDIVIVTDGKNGVHITDNKNYYYGVPHKLSPVETTGAGDAFGSSFLTGMILKNDIQWATKLAITNSESVIMHHGAKECLLTYKQALAAMRKNPVKVKKSKF